MPKLIIYPIGETIAVIHPCDCGLTVNQIAQKDVPEGVKYCIIDDTDLPSDRTNRDAWTADFTTYDGIGGA